MQQPQQQAEPSSAARKSSFFGRKTSRAFAKAGQRDSVFGAALVLKDGYLEKQSSGMVKK